MSTVGPEGRSYELITKADLRRLLELAVQDLGDFFARHPRWAAFYSDRVLAVALCQGAALHYCFGEVGINDFDVYTFFAAHPERRWYAKRHAVRDFGEGKFGRSKANPGFQGRRVDLLGRSIPAGLGDNPVVAIRGYLRAGRTLTARLLAQKAVVLLQPKLGFRVWPTAP